MTDPRYTASIALLLPLLLLALICGPATATAQQAEQSAMAIVNGTPIPFDQYQRLRDDYIAASQGTIDRIEQKVDDELFLQLVDEVLLEQEAAKLGITVSTRDATTALLSEPPDFIRATFTDADGTFRREVFRTVVRDPSAIATVVSSGGNKAALIASWKEDLRKVIGYVRIRELKRRVTDELYKRKPLTPQQVMDRYFAEKTLLMGSFIRVLHQTAPDTLAPVTLEEAREYYQKNRERYRFRPAREITAAIVPLVPTRSDSAAHARWMDSIHSVISTTPLSRRDAKVAEVARALPASRFPMQEPVPLGAMPRQIQDQLRKAKPGELIGPFPQEREAVYLYVSDVRPVRDTVVRLRHVLIKAPQEHREADSTARALITVLRDSIDSESEFRDAATYFSQDGSSSAEGDLGFISRGTLIDEVERLAFSTPVGQMAGPVRSIYGYHLIWVTDRTAEGHVLHELRFPIEVSPEHRASAMKDLRAYARTLFNAEPADSIVAELRRNHPSMILDTSLIERLQPYGDLLVTGEFAFGAQVGDVAIVNLPYNRIAVLQVRSIRPGGIPEFEKFPNYVAAHLLRDRQLDLLEPRIERLSQELTADMLIGPLREIAPMAEVFLIDDKPVQPPPDEPVDILDSLVVRTGAGEVSGPVRGTHGYYFLRVLSKSGPTMADFERQRAKFTEEYTERYRRELLEERLADARAFAEIEDLRPATRKLLEE